MYVEAGHGLIKDGSSLMPFVNMFPKNTKLYKLLTTKSGESAQLSLGACPLRMICSIFKST